MSSAVPRPKRAAPMRKAPCAPASVQARRQAATILEVLAGVRRPSEAAAALETSVPRYYQLEQRALAGLLAACEPSPRGRQVDVSRRITALERENRRLQRECDRQHALVRATERALGLATPATAGKPPGGKLAAKDTASKPGSGSAKRRRSRRPTVRALKAARVLQAEAAANPSDEVAAVAGTPGKAEA